MGAGAPGAGLRYIASMVGRKDCPNGVERKSVGKSGLNKVRRCSRLGPGRNHTFDMRRDRASSEKPNAIIRKRVAIKFCREVRVRRWSLGQVLEAIPRR